MSDKMLKKLLIISLTSFLFVIGIYVGNNTSYSIETEDKEVGTNYQLSKDDNKMYLNSFKFEEDKAKAGDFVSVSLDTSGALIEGASIQLVREDKKYTISSNIKKKNDTYYLELPKFINSGNYLVKSLVITGINSDETTFTKNFTKSPSFANDVYYNFNDKIYLEADFNNIDVDIIESVDLKKNTFSRGEKLYIDIKAHKDVRSIRFNFVKDQYSSFYAYVNSLSTKPYLMIASSASLGEYSLDNIYVETNTYGSVTYSNIHNDESKYVSYDDRVVLLDTNKDKSVVYYNNSDVTKELIDEISNNEDINDIHVMAEDESVISEDLIRFVKDSNKNLIVHYKNVEYKFKDINDNKMFNAAVSYKVIDANSKIGKVVSDGLVMDFAANGELPGTINVKLYKSGLFDEAFDNDKVNVYYYREDSNQFETIKEDLSIKDGYLSFDISHASSYVITNSKISGVKAYSKNNNDVSKAEKSSRNIRKKVNKNSILLIIMSLLLVIIILLIIVLINNNKKVVKEVKDIDKDKKEEKHEETIDEEDIIENISKANEASFEDEDL